jgi:hypothetical protein
MPSFDIVSEVNKVELKNAIEQSNKEITNRFDFKGSDARIEQNELQLTVCADDDFKLKEVIQIARHEHYVNVVRAAAPSDPDIRGFGE